MKNIFTIVIMAIVAFINVYMGTPVFVTIILLGAIFLIWYFTSINPNRKEEKTNHLEIWKNRLIESGYNPSKILNIKPWAIAVDNNKRCFSIYNGNSDEVRIHSFTQLIGFTLIENDTVLLDNNTTIPKDNIKCSKNNVHSLCLTIYVKGNEENQITYNQEFITEYVAGIEYIDIFEVAVSVCRMFKLFMMCTETEKHINSQKTLKQDISYTANSSQEDNVSINEENSSLKTNENTNSTYKFKSRYNSFELFESYKIEKYSEDREIKTITLIGNRAQKVQDELYQAKEGAVCILEYRRSADKYAIYQKRVFADDVFLGYVAKKDMAIIDNSLCAFVGEIYLDYSSKSIERKYAVDIDVVMQNENDGQYFNKLTYRSAKTRNNYVLLDFETTGLSNDDKIVEVGAAKVVDGKIIDTYNTLIYPDMPIPAEATKIHGITDYDVKDSPSFSDILLELLEFIGDNVVVAYNASFDIRFFEKSAAVRFEVPFKIKYIDALAVAKEAVPGLDSYKLQYMREYFGIKENNAHRSLDDVYVLYEVYENCRKLLKEGRT